MGKDQKRTIETEEDGNAKRVKESFDIPSLISEQSENTIEAKDDQINKLKEALQNTYDSLNAWKDACPDLVFNNVLDPISAKTEFTSMKTLKAQLQDARKRDRSLVMRLSTKEQEIHDLQIQVNEFRQALTPHTRQTTILFDPALTLKIYVQKLKDEIKALEKRLKQAQDDVEAQRFTPQSIMGRKLIMKCRSLQDENEDLGKQLSEGKVHKISQENALQREYSEELKSSLAEANEFVMQLDQEVEVLQHTVFTLQRQLKGYKERETKAKSNTSDSIALDNSGKSKEEQKNEINSNKDEISGKVETTVV